MSGPPSEIILVTPVWNDSARLARYGRELASVLAKKKLPIRWLVADDGSSGEECAHLEALVESFHEVYPHVVLHFAGLHRGKGSVVREVWAAHPDAAWLAFVDADGSVSAGEMIGLIETAVAGGVSVLGIRKHTATTRVVESCWRGLAHRGFLLAARLLLRVRSDDLQCGAKVFRGDDYRRIAPMLRENGLAFDSELLATLSRHSLAWRELAVNWTEKDNGKVRVVRDACAMLCALWRVRRRLCRVS